MSQSAIPVNRPLITESDELFVSKTLKETNISGHTPVVRNLEEKLAQLHGVPNAIAVSSGTTALDLSIEALEIQPGDEVVVPTFTIVSTIANLLRKGAILKLIDADPHTWSMNAHLAAAAIDSKTKLVLPVHIYGMATDMDPILDETKKYGTFILEDSAEALGVKYKNQLCGSIGDAGIFSFYANKVVTGGEGGAIITKNDKFAARVRYFRDLCFQPENRFVHKDLGWNYRINGLSSALIMSQLSRLNEIIERKIQIGNIYTQGLRGHPWFELPQTELYSIRNTYWVYGILLRKEIAMNALELQSRLKNAGVESRRFFCPMHLQNFGHKDQLRQDGGYPIAEELWEKGLYLPSGLGNTDLEFQKVIEILWDLTK